MIDEKKLIEHIKALETAYQRFWEKFDSEDDFWDMNACGSIIAYIEDMQKVGEWIPCSERLPKEARAVEVTMYDGNRAIGHFYNRLDTWFDSINDGAIDVIAWKEPSEPWEGGKE